MSNIHSILATIDECRRRAGLSKAELARRIGVKPESVRRLFSTSDPNPTSRTLDKLCAALDLELLVVQATDVGLRRGYTNQSTNYESAHSPQPGSDILQRPGRHPDDQSASGPGMNLHPQHGQAQGIARHAVNYDSAHGPNHLGQAAVAPPLLAGPDTRPRYPGDWTPPQLNVQNQFSPRAPRSQPHPGYPRRS